MCLSEEWGPIVSQFQAEGVVRQNLWKKKKSMIFKDCGRIGRYTGYFEEYKARKIKECHNQIMRGT